MKSHLVLSVSLLALIAASCAPEPRLAVAPTVAADQWQQSGSGNATASWAAFGSPALDALIARARAANADIAIAAARVVQARGQLGVARAAARPSLSASGDAGVFSGGGNRRFTAGNQTLGLDVAYDVDLFGRIAAGKRTGRAQLAASRFDRDAAALAVESEVARGFVQHATFGARLALLNRALVNARELDRIIGVRVREGVATRVDSGLQRIEVRRIEAEVSRVAESQIRTRNALAVLVGEEAPSFRLVGAELDAFARPAFDASRPGMLLVRRPDIRAAEARIAAASGNIDAARAAFLPSLRLSGGSLLGGGSGGPLGLVVSAGSSLLAPIFSGGRLRGELLTASGLQRESVETYRRALLAGLSETEDALAGVAQSDMRISLLADTIVVARTTARLARRQYVEGAADLQIVLNAERGALDVEDAYAVALQDRLEAAINLYRALGGGPELNAAETAAR